MSTLISDIDRVLDKLDSVVSNSLQDKSCFQIEDNFLQSPTDHETATYGTATPTQRIPGHGSLIPSVTKGKRPGLIQIPHPTEILEQWSEGWSHLHEAAASAVSVFIPDVEPLKIDVNWGHPKTRYEYTTLEETTYLPGLPGYQQGTHVYYQQGPPYYYQQGLLVYQGPPGYQQGPPGYQQDPHVYYQHQQGPPGYDRQCGCGSGYHLLEQTPPGHNQKVVVEQQADAMLAHAIQQNSETDSYHPKELIPREEPYQKPGTVDQNHPTIEQQPLSMPEFSDQEVSGLDQRKNQVVARDHYPSSMEQQPLTMPESSDQQVSGLDQQKNQEIAHDHYPYSVEQNPVEMNQPPLSPQDQLKSSEEKSADKQKTIDLSPPKEPPPVNDSDPGEDQKLHLEESIQKEKKKKHKKWWPDIKLIPNLGGLGSDVVDSIKEYISSDKSKGEHESPKPEKTSTMLSSNINGYIGSGKPLKPEETSSMLSSKLISQSSVPWSTFVRSHYSDGVSSWMAHHGNSRISPSLTRISPTQQYRAQNNQKGQSIESRTSIRANPLATKNSPVHKMHSKSDYFSKSPTQTQLSWPSVHLPEWQDVKQFGGHVVHELFGGSPSFSSPPPTDIVTDMEDLKARIQQLDSDIRRLIEFYRNFP